MWDEKLNPVSLPQGSEADRQCALNLQIQLIKEGQNQLQNERIQEKQT